MRFVFNLTVISFEIDQTQSLIIFFPMQDQSCIFRCFGFVSFIVQTISSLKGNKVFCSMESFNIFTHRFYYVKIMLYIFELLTNP